MKGKLLILFVLFYLPMVSKLLILIVIKYLSLAWCQSLLSSISSVYSSCISATISIDLSGEVAVCPGGSITITATHPTLGGDSGYLPSIFWIRNGSDYNTDGLFEDISTTSTKTTLTITCGGDFPFGTTYQAFIINQVTKCMELSEVITIITEGEGIFVRFSYILSWHMLSLFSTKWSGLSWSWCFPISHYSEMAVSYTHLTLPTNREV